MTVSALPSKTEPTTPRFTNAMVFMSLQPKGRRMDPGSDKPPASETSILQKYISEWTSFETSWKQPSPSAYEGPEERADTQEALWEALLSKVVSSARLFTTGATDPERSTTEPLSTDISIPPGRRYFASQILAAIEAEPVEDGYSHPAELLLKHAVIDQPIETVLWLYNIVSSESNGSIVAAVLKCLGRIEVQLCRWWGFQLIATALEHPDIEVRDAAVQVLETWGTDEAVRLLKQRMSRERVDWLRSYIERVIEDLRSLGE